MKSLSIMTAVLFLAGVASAQTGAGTAAPAAPAATEHTDAAAPKMEGKAEKKMEKKKHSKKKKGGAEGETH